MGIKDKIKRTSKYFVNEDQADHDRDAPQVEDAKEAVDAKVDDLKTLAEQAKTEASEQVAQAEEAATQAKEDAAEEVQKVQQAAEEAVGEAKESADQAVESAKADTEPAEPQAAVKLEKKDDFFKRLVGKFKRFSHAK